MKSFISTKTFSRYKFLEIKNDLRLRRIHFVKITCDTYDLSARSKADLSPENS